MINFVGSFHYTAWMALALFFLISCNYLLMILVGTILEKPRLQGISLLLFCVLSTLLCCAVANSLHMTMGVWYSLLGLVLLTEFYIFHQDGFVKTLFITLSCVVHLLAMRAICVAVLAMIGQKNFFTIVNNGDTFWLSTALTALVADVAIILVLKFIPKGKIKIIGQYKEQLWFMLAWQILYATYFIFTARVYNIDLAYPFLNSIQIATSVTVLLGAYIVLFFSFTTTSLLGYKDKNLVLELEIEKQQQYRASMLTDAITSFEFNLSKNEIISGLDAYQAAFGHQGTYNQVLIFAAQHVVHYDDLIAFIEHVNVARVMEMYNKGKNEISIEYRRLLDTGDYIWVRSTTNLMRDHSSGDVKAFTYVRNIDEEKKARLALEYKAERDVLTGLCNKAMLVQLISDYLHQVETISGAGTLFMVDIDDFKNINDSLGHVYGDAVLRELGEKLSKCFREDDIVGRLGGDEFMALMKGAHHTKAIEEKALEICKAFHNSYQGDGTAGYEISGSVGIAIFPQHGDTFEELYKKADIALYISKNKGKNTYSIYEGEHFTSYKSSRGDYDDLTGAMGFRKFKQEAKAILTNHQKKNYIFVRVDINDFKALNGIYGFDEGDKILTDMAKAIALTIEPRDIFARMTNDNFAVLASYRDEISIYQQGERFKENFHKIHTKAPEGYPVSFSIGFSIIEQGETDMLSIIEKSTLAHATAKKNGIGMICYSDFMQESLAKEKTMEDTMHEALETGQFIVCLQPKYALASEGIKGAEALVRWLDPWGAWIPPSEFIPLFEANGFIVQLDLFVLEQVFQLQKAYLDQGIHPVTISINQSKLLVLMGDYVERVGALVKQYELPPFLIGLEITEATILGNPHKLAETIGALQAMGFIVAIDHFGENYAPVSMLKEMKADVLKIDRAFLAKTQGDQRGEILLSHLMGLAKALAMKVVAVGVETQGQADWLSLQSCDLVQGYLYNKPLSIEEFGEICYN